MAVKAHRFNGVLFNIRIEPPDETLEGYCESPREKKDDPTICIIADTQKKIGLITLLEESLHAEGWAKDHKVVSRCAAEIGSLLWRLGYRRRG